MPGNMVFSHICEAWQPEDYVPRPVPPPPHNEFLIEMYVNFMYVSSSWMFRDLGDEPEHESGCTLSPTVYRTFRQKLEHLTKDSTSWSTISSMLSQVDVPYHLQPFMIGRISKAARSIASTSGNHSLRTLPMVVSIRVVVPVYEELGFGTEEESDWSCIEGLHKVRIGEDCVGDYDNQCMICLEEIPAGSEATSMPCSHFYHEDCIVNWLQRSNLCPLCRFQILASSSDLEEH